MPLPFVSGDHGRPPSPMDDCPSSAPDVDAALLIQAQHYLVHRVYGVDPGADREADWLAFHERYSRRIRKFAVSCGAGDEDLADCVQDVWAELLKRLPTFRLDKARGQFDSWLFHIVRSKTVNRRRRRKYTTLPDDHPLFDTSDDRHTGPARQLEDAEWFAAVEEQLQARLSECSFEVLRLRLIEDRPVAEVAELLDLTHEQVWYRYHRARREAAALASSWDQSQSTRIRVDTSHEENGKLAESAQGKKAKAVSRIVGPHFLVRQGGHCVDYVFQRLELGRRELSPEWKVEWDCEADPPKPMLYIRKSAVVAYAEICGPDEYVNANWPRIVNAAITAGVAAGIATIIATPSAALPVFQAEFQRQLQGKGCAAADERVQVALSARQEANGPWGQCKD